MFKDDPNHKVKTLELMHAEAIRESNFNQLEARRLVVERVKQDRRFDPLDPERVAEKVFECKQSRAVFDVEDPYLKRGGQARPLQTRPSMTGSRG
jgi:hypothetical protein